MSNLTFFRCPPISPAGMRRLLEASNDAPPLRFGESRCEGVKALQQALIAMSEASMYIPDGPTGNYLRETEAAVRAFQIKFHLRVDGVAGCDTIRALDVELTQRSQRVLQRLDRCIDGCRYTWYLDAYRRSILNQLQLDLRQLKSTNSLGFAVAGVALVLLVLLFFAIMMFCAMPQNQTALRQLMSQTIEAVRGRGEVAQEKLEELKAKIREFVRQCTDIKSDCETEKAQTDPDKFRECKRLMNLALKAAFDKLMNALLRAVDVIYSGPQGVRFSSPSARAGREAFVLLADAFKDYLNALNDFFRCLGCPEIPIPIFPDYPLFP